MRRAGNKQRHTGPAADVESKNSLSTRLPTSETVQFCGGHKTPASPSTFFNAFLQGGSRRYCSVTSKIRRREFVGSFALSVKRLRGRCVDRRPIVVESKKQAHLIARHCRLQPTERVFRYEERPFHRAVMPPEPNGTSGRIKNSASIWKVEHGPRRFVTRRQKSSICAGLRHPAPTRNFLRDCARIF